MVSIFTSRSTVAFLAIVTALFIASASASAADPHAKQCYEQYQKCCYIPVECGYITKSVKVTPRCDYKHCHKQCKPYCQFVKKTVPIKTCVHGSCSLKYIKVQDKVCKSVCKDVCKWIKAVCIKYKVFQYTKFCYKVDCEKLAIDGNSKSPVAFVGKDAKLVGVHPGTRKIIEAAH